MERKTRTLVVLITLCLSLTMLAAGCDTNADPAEETLFMSRFFNSDRTLCRFENIEWGSSKQEMFGALGMDEGDFTTNLDSEAGLVRVVPETLADTDTRIEATYWFDGDRFISGWYLIEVASIEGLAAVCDKVREQMDTLGIATRDGFGGIGTLEQLSESSVRDRDGQSQATVIAGGDAAGAQITFATQSPNQETGLYIFHISIDAPR